MDKPIILCDIDGTLANCEHRLHFIRQYPKDWDGFFGACRRDEPIAKIISLVQRLEHNFEIVFFTGRPELCRVDTIAWLEKNVTSNPIILEMRKNGDHQEDYRVKSNMFDAFLADPFPLTNVDIAFVIDDRPQVIRMWQDRGIPVLDVGKQEEF